MQSAVVKVSQFSDPHLEQRLLKNEKRLLLPKTW